MELPLQLCLKAIQLGLAKVSILVLMELPLQLRLFLYFVPNLYRFNPCFNGTTSATQDDIFVKFFYKIEFQSLF